MGAISKKQRTISIIFLVAALVVLVGGFVMIYVVRQSVAPSKSVDTLSSSPSATTSGGDPPLSEANVMNGLTKPWDVTFLPDSTMLVAENAGQISSFKDGQSKKLFAVPGTDGTGEGGLMGMVADGDFAANRFIYTCYASKTGGDIRVSRWTLAKETNAFGDRKDIVTNIPHNANGRHSGCRLAQEKSGTLWIGTGDAAEGTNPQSPTSLGGKILRVDREGKAVAGNQKAPFDTRIYSYGHRNVQGLTLYPQAKNGSAGFSIEQGPSVEDEVNRLVPGNFGWNPVPAYNELVAMTDTKKYTDAVTSAWNSGDSTIAPSGGTLLSGKQWKDWDGALAVAVLKGKELRIQRYTDQGKLIGEKSLLKETYGRLRTAVQGTDGNLYITTDNGGDKDVVVRVTPK